MTCAMTLAVLAVAACQAADGSGERSPRADEAEPQHVSEAAKAECRRLASLRAEQEYAQGRAATGGTYGREIRLQEDLDRYDAAKRREALYRRCLRGLTPAATLPQGTTGRPGAGSPSP